MLAPNLGRRARGFAGRRTDEEVHLGVLPAHRPLRVARRLVEPASNTQPTRILVASTYSVARGAARAHVLAWAASSPALFSSTSALSMFASITSTFCCLHGLARQLFSAAEGISTGGGGGD
eukprot:5849200-Prymnesium_polylepis.1